MFCLKNKRFSSKCKVTTNYFAAQSLLLVIFRVAEYAYFCKVNINNTKHNNKLIL